MPLLLLTMLMFGPYNSPQCARSPVTFLRTDTPSSNKRRDPLTQAETEELRQVGFDHPLKRLRLYVKFSNVRLDQIDRLRSDTPDTEARGQHVHDLLEDFTAILDEINDNLDQMEAGKLDKQRRAEFHDGLKELIGSLAGWKTRLETLKMSATRSEIQYFQFVLADSLDAVGASADMASEYLNSKT